MGVCRFNVSWCVWCGRYYVICGLLSLPLLQGKRWTPPLLPNAHEHCSPSFAVNSAKSSDAFRKIHCIYQLLPFPALFLAPFGRNSGRGATLPGTRSLPLSTWPNRHVAARCAFTLCLFSLFFPEFRACTLLCLPRSGMLHMAWYRKKIAIVHMNALVGGSAE